MLNVHLPSPVHSQPHNHHGQPLSGASLLSAGSDWNSTSGGRFQASRLPNSRGLHLASRRSSVALGSGHSSSSPSRLPSSGLGSASAAALRPRSLLNVLPAATDQRPGSVVPTDPITPTPEPPSQHPDTMTSSNRSYGQSTAVASRYPISSHHDKLTPASSMTDQGYYSSTSSNPRQPARIYPPPYQNYAQHQYSVSQPNSRPASGPVSPIFPLSTDDESVKTRSSNNTSIVSYLQIPSSITSSKGSLAEFAAQITCLFWFESSTTLKYIEDSEASPLQGSTLVPEAFPTTGFLKWVTTMLSTTQVTQNVILLALLFIYRLKKQNPSVKGKPGSEYRLLTVALMLGNKFLDDNTYTNKTWAEVSGISVHEIHVMEVEFLSHMKYNLYTSKAEWQRWHVKLGKFWRYFDQASKKMKEGLLKPLQLRPTLQIPQALPSPPASSNASPPFVSSSSPVSTPFSSSTVLAPYLGNPAISPRDAMSAIAESDNRVYLSNGRKRSYDQAAGYETDEPQIKRHTMYSTTPAYPDMQQSSGPRYSISSNSTGSVGNMASLPSLPNLPVPTLPIPQANNHQLYNQALSTSSTSSPSSRAPAPPSAGPRQPTTPMAHLPPVGWLNGVGNLTPSSSASLGQPAGYYAPTPATNYSAVQDTPSRRNTPKSSITPGAGSSNGRILANSAQIPSIAAHTTTQSQLSPSFFLTQRSSPYRPVRNISTLLVPPPQSSIQNPTSSISYDQMSWQPLSKNVNNNEPRTGRVPYLHREAWPRTHQVDQWPTMYPPN